MSSVEEEESAVIRNAKSMRLAQKIEHEEAMQEHQQPDVIPQAPTVSYTHLTLPTILLV